VKDCLNCFIANARTTNTLDMPLLFISRIRSPVSARIVCHIVALGFAALTAACSSGVAPYSCYYSDIPGSDRQVEGRTVHWCGPVPRGAV
jgi:hypothetical protein